jgi:uncharacterized LabA/DUF88 family protein
MIFRNKSQRVAVLVDVQNLYYTARNVHNSRIHFKNLLELAVAGRVLTRAIAYAVNTEVNAGEKDFFDAIHNSGFDVKEKELQIFADGSKKADWDIGIAMDAIRLGHKVDSIVLVSGDGDYVPVVSYLQQSLGCLVEVIAFSRSTSHHLKDVCDDFTAIEDYKSKLLFPLTRKKFTPNNNTKNVEPSSPRRPNI